MKTAVQELIDMLDNIEHQYFLTGDADSLMNEIKDRIRDGNYIDKERRQIIEAYNWGETDGVDDVNGDRRRHEDATEYYNETYNNQEGGDNG